VRALIANLTESRWVKAQANWTLPYLEKLIKAAEATNFAKSVKSVNQQLRDDCKRWQKKLSKVTRASAGDEPDEFYGAFLKFFQALAGAFNNVVVSSEGQIKKLWKLKQASEDMDRQWRSVGR